MIHPKLCLAHSKRAPRQFKVEQFRMYDRVTRGRRAKQTKKGPVKAGPKSVGGLNRTQTRARSIQAPGGWGAEESGARTRPGPNQLRWLSRVTTARPCSKL